MADYTIPPQLIDLFKEGRVIPFIGAGFSSVFGLPSWQSLLEDLGHNLGDGLTFQEVSEYAQGDYLQIAEYYYLKIGGHIGPLRHAISQKLPTASIDPLQSGHHVDLINLGMSKIYTTNYDDLLEKTYESLGILKDVIILAKHVATSLGTLPQIVKYHGDLQYEDTLVLTESKYYSRLDFESPMDLKFRADLLGRAVLFLGYSFRDLNIRVIWFKLREMMQDVSPEDRPTSYMVTFEPNPVLETLYQAVGISTIVLDPNGTVQSNEDRSRLLSDFIFDLSLQVCDGTIPNSSMKPFISQTVLRRADQLSKRLIADAPQERRRPTRGAFDTSREFVEFADLLSTRTLTEPAAKQLSEFLLTVYENWRSVFRVSMSSDSIIRVAVNLHQYDPNLPGSAAMIIRGLCREGGRDILQDSQIDWTRVWKTTFNQDIVKPLLTITESEIRGHEEGTDDADVFYCGDLMQRISEGHLANKNAKEVQASAKKLLERIYSRYNLFKDYEPQYDRMPDLDNLAVQAIEEVTGSSAGLSYDVGDRLF